LIHNPGRRWDGGSLKRVQRPPSTLRIPATTILARSSSERPASQAHRRLRAEDRVGPAERLL